MRITYTEESGLDGYTREKDERTTENKMEIEPMQSNETWKSTGLRASEMMDMATMSRKITSHTGDPISSRPT